MAINRRRTSIAILVYLFLWSAYGQLDFAPNSHQVNCTGIVARLQQEKPHKNDFPPEEMASWLKRALSGWANLPHMQDEFPSISLMRLIRSLPKDSQQLVRENVLMLLADFTKTGKFIDYPLEELLMVVQTWPIAEATELLGTMALESPMFWQLSTDHRLAILSVLVDTQPYRPSTFWKYIVQRDFAGNYGMAFSGFLTAQDPVQAVALLEQLPSLPDANVKAQAIKLKLGLYLEELAQNPKMLATDNLKIPTSHSLQIPVYFLEYLSEQLQKFDLNNPVLADMKNWVDQQLAP